jgi:TctA family transporter
MRLLDNINEWIEDHPYNPIDTDEMKKSRLVISGNALVMSVLIVAILMEEELNSYWEFAFFAFCGWLGLFIIMTVITQIFEEISHKKPFTKLLYTVLIFLISSLIAWFI